MTKRLIDVDENKLERVRTLLGAKTLTATVNEAFDEVLSLQARREMLLADRGIDSPELADPKDRRSAWG